MFSDFKVCKDIGSGAFGKIYLVIIIDQLILQRYKERIQDKSMR